MNILTMTDEEIRRMIAAELASYLRRDDVGYQELLRTTEAAKAEAEETKKSSWRNERYIAGGLDEKGVYRPGIAQAIGTMRAVAIWGGGILSAVLVALLVAALENHNALSAVAR